MEHCPALAIDLQAAIHPQYRHFIAARRTHGHLQRAYRILKVGIYGCVDIIIALLWIWLQLGVLRSDLFLSLP